MKISTWEDAVPNKYKDLFSLFCNSIDTLDTVEPYDYDADIAIVWYTNAPVIDSFRMQGKHIITVSPGILTHDTISISIDGVMFIEGVDNCRPRKFPSMTPTWVVGEDILICVPSLEAYNKEVDKIKRKLARITDRFITVLEVPNYDYHFSKILHNYWAVISYSEFCSIHSIIQGVPVFTSSDSITHPISRDIKHITNIEEPYAPDRSEWHAKICHNEWYGEEIITGDVWRYFKATLSTI